MIFRTINLFRLIFLLNISVSATQVQAINKVYHSCFNCTNSVNTICYFNNFYEIYLSLFSFPVSLMNDSTLKFNELISFQHKVTIRKSDFVKLENVFNGIYEDTSIVHPIFLADVHLKEIQFSVRSPKVIPFNRQISEILPLGNSIFFDLRSTDIPLRYIQFNHSRATTFTEQQLQKNQPGNLINERSERQLNVYYNILNILGDRLRVNIHNTILLVGFSNKSQAEGEIMAEKIKNYLVSVFDIKAFRIVTRGKHNAIISFAKPFANIELVQLKEDGRRVEISSTSSDLLVQVGGKNFEFLRPVQISAGQEDPFDSNVIFIVSGASDLLDSWNVTVTDDQNLIRKFGPYKHDYASVLGKSLLGSNQQGNYSIVMTGNTKNGKIITKNCFVSLMTVDNPKQQVLRYSILFDSKFPKTIGFYENFLSEIVVPLIPDNGKVFILGYTDNKGDDKYNYNLSVERAEGTKKILEKALLRTGKKTVKFETYGFGNTPDKAPYDNRLPEGRFYNRTVIIDIISN